MPTIQFLKEAASQKLSNGESLESYLHVLNMPTNSFEWEELVANEICHQLNSGREGTARSVGGALARDLETVIGLWTKTLQRCLNPLSDHVV